MIVLDANVLISYWGAPDVHTSRAFEVLDTEDDLILHPVTLAESLVGPARVGGEAEAANDIVRLGIERHVPLLDEPANVARIRASTRLKLPDAYVLATAEHLGATLATFDRRLADAARERGVEVIGV
jgi:predicted nucleic acid-binding protein